MTDKEIESINYIIQYKDYIIGVFTLVIGYLYYRLRKKNDELISVKEKLSDKKYNLYNSLYSVFFKLIKDAKETNKHKIEKAEKELTEKLLDIKKEMFIYAPDEVLLKFLKWNENINKKEVSIEENMQLFFNILVLIRKDMGNKNTIVNEEDILKSILISEKESSKSKE